ncbi:MAG: PHP domain-containing protein [Nanoarchaeota archaeon]|nr:PHP domain-containing protein [Nanoarchaeota archaeon]MBU1135186.1 PHP domain-containing protein [Nanoarchaeota archaeon]
MIVNKDDSMIVKKWEKYKEYLENGLWHVHTNYTDGKNTVFEMCQKAQEKGFPAIIFAEHVRKTLNYNFDDFLSDIAKASDKLDIKVIPGCETSIMDSQGNLDISEEVAKKSEVVFASFHRPVQNYADYLLSVVNMLKNPIVDVWAHPNIIPKGLSSTGVMIPLEPGMTVEELQTIMTLAAKNKILIENNIRYKTPKDFIDIAKIQGVRVITAYDAHRVGDLDNLDEYKGSYIPKNQFSLPLV